MKIARAGLAFTLLEAMIALIVLAGVASACLQLRAQSLRGRAAAAEATAREAALQNLLDEAVAGFLGEPAERADPDAGALQTVWTGRLHGDPYEVTREIARRTNPVSPGARPGDDQQDPQPIWLARWTAAWRGETIEEWRLP